MRRIIAAAAILSSVSFGAAAMPSQPIQVVGQTYSALPDVIPTAGGCGIGMHRGPYAGCRPNGRVFAPRRVYGSRCVLRRGPFGRVRRVCGF